MKFMMFLPLIGGLIVFLWRTRPPKEVIGSTIPNFDETHFQRRLLKLSDDQRVDLGFPLS